MNLVIEIPGPSCPQGSTRAFISGGRAVITSANKNLSEWRYHAVLCIRAEMEKEGLSEPLTGPVGVSVTDIRIKPKSRKKKIVWADKRPDLDKVVRAAGDALEAAGVFKSDAQICLLKAAKQYGDRAMMIIQVCEISNEKQRGG